MSEKETHGGSGQWILTILFGLSILFVLASLSLSPRWLGEFTVPHWSIVCMVLLYLLYLLSVLLRCSPPVSKKTKFCVTDFLFGGNNAWETLFSNIGSFFSLSVISMIAISSISLWKASGCRETHAFRLLLCSIYPLAFVTGYSAAICMLWCLYRRGSRSSAESRSRSALELIPGANGRRTFLWVIRESLGEKWAKVIFFSAFAMQIGTILGENLLLPLILTELVGVGVLAVDPVIASVILMCFCYMYTSLRGFRAVLLTDAVQVGVMAIVVLSIAAILVTPIGAANNVFQHGGVMSLLKECPYYEFALINQFRQLKDGFGTGVYVLIFGTFTLSCFLVMACWPLACPDFWVRNFGPWEKSGQNPYPSLSTKMLWQRTVVLAVSGLAVAGLSYVVAVFSVTNAQVMLKDTIWYSPHDTVSWHSNLQTSNNLYALARLGVEAAGLAGGNPMAFGMVCVFLVACYHTTVDTNLIGIVQLTHDHYSVRGGRQSKGPDWSSGRIYTWLSSITIISCLVTAMGKTFIAVVGISGCLLTPFISAVLGVSLCSLLFYRREIWDKHLYRGWRWVAGPLTVAAVPPSVLLLCQYSIVNKAGLRFSEYPDINWWTCQFGLVVVFCACFVLALLAPGFAQVLRKWSWLDRVSGKVENWISRSPAAICEAAAVLLAIIAVVAVVSPIRQCIRGTDPDLFDCGGNPYEGMVYLDLSDANGVCITLGRPYGENDAHEFDCPTVEALRRTVIPIVSSWCSDIRKSCRDWPTTEGGSRQLTFRVDEALCLHLCHNRAWRIPDGSIRSLRKAFLNQRFMMLAEERTVPDQGGSHENAGLEFGRGKTPEASGHESFRLLYFPPRKERGWRENAWPIILQLVFLAVMAFGFTRLGPSYASAKALRERTDVVKKAITEPLKFLCKLFGISGGMPSTGTMESDAQSESRQGDSTQWVEKIMQQRRQEHAPKREQGQDWYPR